MWNIFKKFSRLDSRVRGNDRNRPSVLFAGISFAVLLLLPILAQAQARKPYVPAVRPKDTSMFWIFKNVSAGPIFMAGESRQNENLPEVSPGVLWHSSPRFAYAIGGLIDFSINPWIGLDFSALYDSRDLYVADSGERDNIDLSMGYVAFQPSIRIFWLLVGLAFDIPMSGSATENLAAYQHYTNGNPDAPVVPYNQNMNVPTSDLQPLTELRATLSVPVIKGDDAELYIVVNGSYPLSKTLKGTTPSFDTTSGRFSGTSAPGQGPLPTLEAGISYQFDLLH
jgi:hypothetical protein